MLQSSNIAATCCKDLCQASKQDLKTGVDVNIKNLKTKEVPTLIGIYAGTKSDQDLRINQYRFSYLPPSCYNKNIK